MATNETAKWQPDWPAIRTAYEANRLSTRAIARQNGISHTAIQKRAAAEGWVRGPRPAVRTAPPSIRRKPAQVVPVLTNPKDAISLGRNLALRLLDELSTATSYLGEFEQAIVAETAGDPDGRRRQAMLRAVDLPRRAAVLKDLATALRTLGDAAPGKKEAAQEAAGRAGTGRYATPKTPPRLIIDNGRSA